jgi:subtilisin-like proprotein convertase family protein/truncated hemoglobin YjbI
MRGIDPRLDLALAARHRAGSSRLRTALSFMTGSSPRLTPLAHPLIPMSKKILRPLAMLLGLGLVPACPADTATTTDTDTDTDAATSGTSSTPTTSATSGTSEPTSTTAEPTSTTGTTTTADPTTGGDSTSTGDSTTGGDSSTGEPVETLCTRLGGPAEGGIKDLVTSFLGGVLVDERINGYFLNSDVDGGNLLKTVGEQLGVAAECPGVEYSGLPMKEAHAGLKISQQDFLDFAEDFQAALDAHQASHPALTDADKTTILDLLGGLSPDIVEDPTSDMTVYQRVGRKPSIKALIGAPDAADSFIGVVAADATINSFFANSDFARLGTCLTRQVGGIDGPIKYGAEVDSPGPGIDDGVSAVAPCRDMVSAHADLQDADMNPIMYDDFVGLVADLVTAMTTAGVADADQTAILAALGPLCDQIVAGNAEKNKCPGNSKTELVQADALALAIPDGAYDGTLGSMLCHEFMLGADPDGIAFYGDVAVTTAIDHTWVGDLTLKVKSPTDKLLTVFNRPGGALLPDNGSSCCGDSSNLAKDFPLSFKNSGGFDPAIMGKTLGTGQIVCKDDAQCDYKPNHGLGPGLDFTDFLGDVVEGKWTVCLGDSENGDPGMVDALGLEFTRVKYDPKG